MKIKTSELSGAALDWAVALIQFPEPDYEDDDRLVYVHGDDEFHFTPATSWAQGGPIIEKYEIDLKLVAEGEWQASNVFDDIAFHRYFGPTPLIAAMRCYVASKLGAEVEVPDELTQGATA